MRYLLHIGCNKTGTSSLQTYLARSPKNLMKRGIWYPEFGRDGNAHHPLAKALKRKNLSTLDIDEKAIRGVGAPDNTQAMLLSSEAFQSAPDVPYIASYFPPDQTTVVIYVREHVSYLASWYQEVVQSRSTTCSFLQFV